jgi:HK97 family phage portal protein
MNIFKGLFRSRDRPKDKYTVGGSSFLFGTTSSGKVVNERTALQTTAVYACVRVLSEALAGLPLHVYKYNDDGGKEKMAKHPLYRLLHDAPNTEMTSFIFRETLMTHLLIYGNAFAQIVRNGKGQVTALYPLLPSNMDVNRNSSGNLEYIYRSDKGEVKLSRDHVLHIPALGFDGLVGYSPIAMAKQTIGAAIAVEEYGAAFFKNGANPGGVLEHPGIVKDVQRVKDSWNAGYQGSANAHKISILEDGMKFKAVGIPPNEAQFLETRKYSVNEICRLFKVPPHLVGDLEKATFSNIEHQSIDFVVHSVSPWVNRWEQSLQQALILPSEQSDIFIRFNLDGLLRGDYKSRMEGYAIGRQNGWLSANDVRSLEELNRIPIEDGGDLYLINGNMLPLSRAGAFAKGADNEIKDVL